MGSIAQVFGMGNGFGSWSVRDLCGEDHSASELDQGGVQF